MSVKQYIYCEDVSIGYEYHRYTVSRFGLRQGVPKV